MSRLLLTLCLAAAPLGAGAADVAQVANLLQQHGCNGCHALQGNVNGPSYHDIAARYTSKPDGPSYLADKIRNGSSNVWGAAAMPPTADIDDLDLKNIVDWLIAGAPAK